MATIERRLRANGEISYRVKVRRRGFPTRSATFGRKTDARKWAHRIEGDISRGRHTADHKAEKRTVANLVDRYLETLRLKRPLAYPKQKQLLSWWRDQLGARALLDLTPARISEKRDALLAENAGTRTINKRRTPATANRYLAALSKACAVAVEEWHWLQDNPVARVRKEQESPGRVRYLSLKERDDLLAACGKSPMPELELVVMLALTTGMRRGEILALRWPDIDLARGSIVIHEAKNREGRAVPLAPGVLALLGKHAQVRHLHSDLVFARSDQPRGIDFDHAFIDAVRAAHIDNFRFQDLRHTAAAYLAMSGATAAEIAAVLGHKTLATVKRYAHLGDQHTGAVIERMTSKFFT